MGVEAASSSTDGLNLQSTIDECEAKNEHDEWCEETRNILLNLSTSDSDILSFIQEQCVSGELSEGQRLYLNAAMNQRTELTAFLSNMMKTMHETIVGIIGNIG